MGEPVSRDLSAKRTSLISIWGLPLVLLFSLNFTTAYLSPVMQTGLAAVLLAWMGSACAINALRCRRLHCMIAGPVLLVGAALLALMALGTLSLGRDGPIYVIWGTLGIVASSFVPERILGRYLPSKH